MMIAFYESSATLFVFIEQHLARIDSWSPLSDMDKVSMAIPKFGFEFPTERLPASYTRLIGAD